MRGQTLSYLLLSALLAAAGTARAGIVSGSLTTDLPSDQGCYAWANVGADGNGVVSLTAPADVAASYSISGMLDGFDPNLTVIQSITNNTGLPWDSYTLTVNPAPGFTVSNIVVFPPLSQPNYLPNVQSGPIVAGGTAVAGNSIIYSGGLVQPGQTFQAYFTFDITETSGQFNYTVLNSPHSTPEPASLAVLGIGAVALLRRKR
ncbi:MAG TPA: PEP-CTERM sorting domain-containing protein [Phycisphaerae bacterium]|nr:PEP-CTERM sorting domain-containing protein [Phycisphaerae bacterium]